MIVNRLKGILPNIVSNTQASFIPGRQITDNIVIMQEVLHTMRYKQGAKGYMAIKIDFEKAYDRLDGSSFEIHSTKQISLSWWLM